MGRPGGGRGDQAATGGDPVAALRAYLEVDLVELMEEESRPENRSYLQELRCSTALQSRERMLVERTAQQVSDALCAAICAGDGPAVPDPDPTSARVLSGVIADLFLVTGRGLVLQHPRLLLAPQPDESQRRFVRTAATATLTELERCVTGLARQMVPQRAHRS